MKYILLLLLLNTKQILAQVIAGHDTSVIANLKKTVYYLADDKLEGRRTGTAGEKLAYEFIQDRFRKIGLAPLGTNKNFTQEFEVKDGRKIEKETSVYVQEKILALDSDYFPLAFSGDVTGLKINNIDDQNVEYNDLKNAIDENKNNPHFDLKEYVHTEAKKAEASGKKLFVLFNSSTVKDDLSFDSKDKSERLRIPVIYFIKNSILSNGSGKANTGNMNISIHISEKQQFGHNVIGFIDNKATGTIILGAHYDHLGYGEDHNSLYTGKTPMIHNGADDNASGVAALIELAGWLKSSDLKKYNYLFIAFSGEELGLYGSKYFTDHCPVDLTSIDYMLNMDMVGRLNDSTHVLTIGGYGTSPAWGEIIKKEDAFFKIKTDSSGSGPSDHTSFYLKNIPVLFFFTGTHSDYHKPSDDADKINFKGELAVINYIEKVLTATDQKEKLVFAKTRDQSTGRSSFKVTLGIMPDYTFDGNGVRVDGVSEGRPAQKAGIQTGDVLYQLGDHSFSDVETYMQALNKFNKGEATKVKLKRGKDDMVLDVVF